MHISTLEPVTSDLVIVTAPELSTVADQSGLRYTARATRAPANKIAPGAPSFPTWSPPGS